MKRLAIVVGVLLAAWFGARSWYDYTYPETRVRYRLTLEVNTPEGPRTGSGVIQVLFGVQHPFITERNRYFGTRGAARAGSTISDGRIGGSSA